MASLRQNPWRVYQSLTRQQLCTTRLSSRHLSTSSLRSNATNNPLRSRASAAADLQHASQAQRKMILSAAGIITCAAGLYGVIKLDLFGLNELDTKKDDKTASNSAPSKNGAMRMDGPVGFASGGPSLITIQGQDKLEQVPTGTSTIPTFPSTIRLPSSEATEGKQTGDDLAPSTGEEYQLLGLGIRTVSFLSVQVYVVGMYVAKSDITELQRRLLRTAVHPPTTDAHSAISGAGADAATSLVSPERQQLKELLLDPEHGDAAWSAILKDNGIRTAFRIVPTRNTDFMHLRDGWVRGITARAQAKKAAGPNEFQDESFGSSMNDFKAVFGAGKGKAVPKGQTLVLMRDAHGALDALFQPGANEPVKWMGRVADERISRLVWLNYLAGKPVSSEGARASIVDGLMAIVERPLGTVSQKVI
ncbi:Chalcone isomerase [Penicillium cf. griseofulvum]|uniref:Chalcone isomerase n=1 Tax=Penicillium cf. griseofulvum TaxID=2972120 RepID=A0A9W9IVI7_9EURO|nr:Chalcone isomerase [Penicillium cf. griseofulvum]KAJ5430325.1 Chalcone isomerase [Penicillium cf. griseofulvum]KAJ5435904.1 Chalcone isomerase [Penicillium cf. griseofulvum]